MTTVGGCWAAGGAGRIITFGGVGGAAGDGTKTTLGGVGGAGTIITLGG